jgi:type IV pilus assembly protein PilY1
MLHAFDASGGSASGMEQWAFIPDSLLRNLDSMLISPVHKYYVDSTPKVADVWFDIDGDNRKSSGEWRTVLVCGLRKGGNTYFALDITDPGAPTFLWEIQLDGKNSGQSWSEPAIGRVMVEGKSKGKTVLTEKWVAFIGGGVDDQDSTKGRAFYVVDLENGNVLWNFSHDAKATDEASQMLYAFPSSPTAVDTNFDGFVDKVYIGDLGGQMWVFDVSSDDIRMKSDSIWTGKRLFTAPVGTLEKHPIYYEPAVAFDRRGTPWVFFGTGDREDPAGKRSQGTNISPTPGTTFVERFYGVMDEGQGTYPRQEATLFNATATNTFNIFKTDPGVKGWYLQLANLEKVLARPAVFNRLLYFTTYTATGSDACQVYGNGRLYTVEYLSGGGAIGFSEAMYLAGEPSPTRSSDIGSGIPSAPVVSILNSGGATVYVQTTDRKFESPKAHSRPISKDFLYWREVLH